MPSISIVVPVYKVEKYLARCVDSILCQSFNSFDLILVDDGSPDQCGEICESYKRKDNRVVVIHQNNRGLSEARNAGIDWAFKYSDSEWITFIDSDDWVDKYYLEQLYNANKINGTDISICRFIRAKEYQTDINDSLFSFSTWTVSDFFEKNNVEAVTAWGSLYKKELFKSIRFPAGRIHEDEFTTYKVLFQCDKVTFVDLNLYYYFDTPNSIINQNWSIKRTDVLDALNERYCYFSNMGNDRLAVFTDNLYKITNSKMNIIARKKGLAAKYPEEHKMNMFAANIQLIKMIGYDKYEFFIAQYYPLYTKILSYFRRQYKRIKFK